MRRLDPLVLPCLLLLLPVAAAAPPAWEASDPAGDASPALANAWADILHARLDPAAGALDLGLARASVLPPGAAYVAAYRAGDETLYCAMLQDVRAVLYFTGAWDDATERPATGASASGAFAPGEPATVRVTGCAPPRDPVESVRFLALDVKTNRAGRASDVLDEAAAAPPPADPPAVAQAERRASPAAPLAALALAAGLAARLRKVA